MKEAFATGLALHQAGRFDEAEAIYRTLMRAAPTQLAPYNNLVALLRAKRRWRDAEEVLRNALAVTPDDAELQFNLATSLLASGDYAAGWPLYEARRRVLVGRVEPPASSLPEWRGEPVASLLIWAEQGFGDQILFARFAPLLKARGVRVTLVCPPPMARLFEALGVTVLAAAGDIVVPPHDAWVLLGSLPLRLGVTLQGLPAAAYLPGQAGGQGVGVLSRGRPTPGGVGEHRALPDEMAGRLLGLPGAVSLHPDDTGARDFAETAEIVRGLERVVSVDTAVAHLAAAMGPTWILLPAVGTDWRWLRDRRDSPWYPSAELFRQQRPGDWEPVLAEVERRLALRP